MSKVALIILDGYGIGNQDENNAIWMAKTPVIVLPDATIIIGSVILALFGAVLIKTR